MTHSDHNNKKLACNLGISRGTSDLCLFVNIVQIYKKRPTTEHVDEVPAVGTADT